MLYWCFFLPKNNFSISFIFSIIYLLTLCFGYWQSFKMLSAKFSLLEWRLHLCKIKKWCRISIRHNVCVPKQIIYTNTPQKNVMSWVGNGYLIYYEMDSICFSSLFSFGCRKPKILLCPFQQLLFLFL